MSENLNTIKDCFSAILNGDRDDSRLAARRVKKLLYSPQGDRGKYDEIKNIINNAPNEYEKISEEWRQENFVMAVSVIYFLHDKEQCPDFLFPWLLELLRHSKGNIRLAAVRMICNELGPLSVHRFPDDKYDKLKPERADKILYALFMTLHGMLADLRESKYKKYKYIDSLPASPYKSVQMVLADMEDMCGEDYIRSLLN